MGVRKAESSRRKGRWIDDRPDYPCLSEAATMSGPMPPWLVTAIGTNPVTPVPAPRVHRNRASCRNEGPARRRANLGDTYAASRRRPRVRRPPAFAAALGIGAIQAARRSHALLNRSDRAGAKPVARPDAPATCTPPRRRSRLPLGSGSETTRPCGPASMGSPRRRARTARRSTDLARVGLRGQSASRCRGPRDRFRYSCSLASH